MIRAKRYSIHQHSHMQQINKGRLNLPENYQNYCVHNEDYGGGQLGNGREGLVEISHTVGNRIDRPSQHVFNKTQQLFSDRKFHPHFQPKEKENIYIKIAELIKNQELPLPIYIPNNIKKPLPFKQRPYTSLSRKSRASFDYSQPNKCSVVLEITKNQDVVQAQKISTSRALMNHSTVYRNHSNGKFKAKKNKTFMSKFVQLFAQKMLIQQKQKIQKKEPVQRLQTTSFNRKTITKQKQKRNRYDENQQFQIGAWDYFE